MKLRNYGTPILPFNRKHALFFQIDDYVRRCIELSQAVNELNEKNPKSVVASLAATECGESGLVFFFQNDEDEMAFVLTHSPIIINV